MLLIPSFLKLRYINCLFSITVKEEIDYLSSMHFLTSCCHKKKGRRRVSVHAYIHSLTIWCYGNFLAAKPTKAASWTDAGTRCLVRSFVSFRAALGVRIICKVIPIAEDKSSKISCLKKEISKPVTSGGLSCILSWVIEVATRKAV